MTTKKTAKAAPKAAAKPKTDPAIEGAKATAKSLVEQVKDDTHVELATPAQEDAMRREATSPKAREAALAAGKKDPLEKYGDPNAAPDHARRAAFGV